MLPRLLTWPSRPARWSRRSSSTAGPAATSVCRAAVLERPQPDQLQRQHDRSGDWLAGVARLRFHRWLDRRHRGLQLSDRATGCSASRVTAAGPTGDGDTVETAFPGIPHPRSEESVALPPYRGRVGYTVRPRNWLVYITGGGASTRPPASRTSVPTRSHFGAPRNNTLDGWTDRRRHRMRDQQPLVGQGRGYSTSNTLRSSYFDARRAGCARSRSTSAADRGLSVGSASTTSLRRQVSPLSDLYKEKPRALARGFFASHSAGFA